MTAESSIAARVPLVERDGVPAEVAVLYDKLYEDRGVVPNMFKALANVPTLVVGISAMLKPLMAEGALAGWYKELIATRVASLNRCEYCVSAHRYLARHRGASQEQVASLDSFETGPFTEKEKAGFRYAGLLHGSGNDIDEAAFAALISAAAPAARSPATSPSTGPDACGNLYEMALTLIPSRVAASACVYSWSTIRLSIWRSSDPSWSRHFSTSRTKITASSKVRTGRLEAHPRATGSPRIEGALPTCIEAYR
jgi:AhpD family alkylhydroperoxidase